MDDRNLANAGARRQRPSSTSVERRFAGRHVDTGAIGSSLTRSSILDYRSSSAGLYVLIIAPLQEANGSWTRYGCDPANFKAAFRAYVDIFRQRGIDETKVRWAFAPNGWTSPGCGSLADYYPGDAYVDILSFSAYNFGTCVGSGWDSVYYVMNDPVSELKAINPTKRIGGGRRNRRSPVGRLWRRPSPVGPGPVRFVGGRPPGGWFRVVQPRQGDRLANLGGKLGLSRLERRCEVRRNRLRLAAERLVHAGAPGRQARHPGARPLPERPDL